MIRFYDRFLPIFVALLFALLIFLSRSMACASETIGETCAALGVTTMAVDQQDLIACMKDKKGALVWKSMTGGQGGAPAGTIAFFALAACPEGWSFADGANKTLDLRGEFLRVWDGGKGVDNGRLLGSKQGDAIRNITGRMSQIVSNNGLIIGSGAFTNGSYLYSWNWGGNSGTYPYSGSVDFNAARVVPTADENRPRNVALLACQKL